MRSAYRSANTILLEFLLVGCFGDIFVDGFGHRKLLLGFCLDNGFGQSQSLAKKVIPKRTEIVAIKLDCFLILLIKIMEF